MKLRSLCLIISALIFNNTAMAVDPYDYKGTVKDYVEKNVLPWVEDEAIVQAIEAQNAKNRDLTADQIAGLDRQWRAEIAKKDQPLIGTVLTSPLSSLLKEKQKQARNAISEIIVMDNKGINVGISDITSDYFQGDEDKFIKSYVAGKDGFYVGDLEKDESTQNLQSNVSVTVLDRAGNPIGALSVGISLDGIL